MCYTLKTIYTVCAHSKMHLVECHNMSGNPNKATRFDCIAAPCPHSQSLHTILGFCDKCVSVYNNIGQCAVNSYAIVQNYWAYKNEQGWSQPVDALQVPFAALLQPPRLPPKPKKGLVASLKNAMSASKSTPYHEEATLVKALGTLQLKSPSCPLCQKGDERDLGEMAKTMFRATLEWAESMGQADVVIHRAGCICDSALSFTSQFFDKGPYRPEVGLPLPPLPANQFRSLLKDTAAFPRRREPPVPRDVPRDPHRSPEPPRDEPMSSGSNVPRACWQRDANPTASSSNHRRQHNNPRGSSNGHRRRHDGPAGSSTAPSGTGVTGLSGANGASFSARAAADPARIRQNSTNAFVNFDGSWIPETRQSDRSPVISDASLTGWYDEARRRQGWQYENQENREDHIEDHEDHEDAVSHEAPQYHVASYARLMGWREEKHRRHRQQHEEQDDTIEEYVDVHLDDGTGNYITQVRRMTFHSPSNSESSQQGSPTSSPEGSVASPSSPNAEHDGSRSEGLRPRETSNRRPLPEIPPTSPLPNFDDSADQAASSSSTRKTRRAEAFGSSSGHGLEGGTFGDLSSSLGGPARDASASRPDNSFRWCPAHGFGTGRCCHRCRMSMQEEIAMAEAARRTSTSEWI